MEISLINDSEEISCPLLSICIPTYNRASYLSKNLERLKSLLIENNVINICTITISNNASTDETDKVINEFIRKNKNIQINYHLQDINAGAKKNLLYVIDKSPSEYIMLLGDDDYIHEEYFKRVLQEIRLDKEITCILPSFQAIDEDGKIMDGYGRDLNAKTEYYAKGYKNLLINSHRAHQLSGITIRRDTFSNLRSIYDIDNIYPQIYFTANACLKGKTLHFPEYPIMVTQTQKKDWSYDNVGLLHDIFDNYKRLPLSDWERFLVEMRMIKLQYWRILQDRFNPFKQVKNTFDISFGKNTSIFGHLIHPLLISYLWIISAYESIIRKIIK